MIKILKSLIKKNPVLFKLWQHVIYFIRSRQFQGTAKYWEGRYKQGGNSGASSYNRLAAFKADVINSFVEKKNIATVIDFGCGDGNNLTLMKFPHYTGLDVSQTAIEICMEKFKHDSSKSFFLYSSVTLDNKENLFKAQLSLSLDVIYHIMEDDLYDNYMQRLFGAAEKYVIIYSKLEATRFAHHEKSRDFLKWIEINEPSFKLCNTIENRYKFDAKDPNNTSEASFYFFERI